MIYTDNLQLKKPELSDNLLAEDVSDNLDILDEKVQEALDAMPPVASTSAAGIVKPDGTTVTVDADGTIHGAQTYVLPKATPSVLGGVRVGPNLTINDAGVLSAFAEVVTDTQPTQGSANVPLSGGTWTMINAVGSRVTTLENSVAGLALGLIWQDAVSTFADIATTYTTPEQGWTVCALDTGLVYWYDGADWLHILTFVENAATDAEIEAVWDGDVT